MKYSRAINKLKSFLGLNKMVVKAVYEKNLKEFLISLGVFKDIESGKYHCETCEKVIDMDNLEIIIIQDKKIKIICSNKTCLKNVR